MALLQRDARIDFKLQNMHFKSKNGKEINDSSTRAELMSHRYWIQFENAAFLGSGCGITAHDMEDAKRILAANLGLDYSNLRITKVIEDVDVSTLDQLHVIPNMASVLQRGIWFPSGLDKLP